MKRSDIFLIAVVLLLFAGGCRSSRTGQPSVNVAVNVSPEIIQEKLFGMIDLPVLLAENQGKDLPEYLTLAKKKVKSIVTGNEIDGISILTDDNSTGIAGQLAAEALLIKPYLVIFIEYKGESALKEAEDLKNNGSADHIMPFTLRTISAKEKKSVTSFSKRRMAQDVFGLNLSAVTGSKPGGQKVHINGNSSPLVTDSEGNISFFAPDHDTIVLDAGSGSMTLVTAVWNIPYIYKVYPEGNVSRISPWVELRELPAGELRVPEFEFLAKTDFPSVVSIEGDSVKQYKTGIFFKKISLKEGSNRVRTEVITKDSGKAFYETELLYKRPVPREPFPLWINERSADPAYDLVLLPSDIMRFSFQGSKGQEAFLIIEPGNARVKCSGEDFSDYTLYRCEIPMQLLKKGKPLKVSAEIRQAGNVSGNKVLKVLLKNSLEVREPEDFPLIRVTKENSRLVYNLGAPRLGGPVRMELDPGVLMKVNGIFGENYRIRLSGTENGFISKNEVQSLPAGTVKPAYYITSMSCGPSKDADVLSIPWPEPVAYEVYPEPDQKRIVITLFGVESASTWITHMAGRRMIERVTWEQSNPETYRIYVNLNSSDIWGYSLIRDGKRLVLRVKYPPDYEPGSVKPLTGLKIAIEAGHGGSGLGAIGLSGLLEKNVNLDLSLRLGELLTLMGAEIVQVRDSDKDMGLIEKRDIVKNSNADLFVSIHANAGGGGYLRAAGTSTYWNNPFWAPLAENIYHRLLETGLKEFGVVGSFNYTPIRLSEMPSILVEQAFMSHAEDEEKLADPEFRQKMAQKISEGIMDYLKYMKQ